MLVAAIYSQRLVGVGITHLAIFQDLQEECPILSLAQSGHIVFSAQQLGIIDSSEATYFIIPLHHGEGDFRRCDIDAYRFLFVQIEDDV